MSNPAKVLAFLDLAGNWNPSLVLVMVSAITIAAVGFRFAKKMPVSFSGLPLRIPTLKEIDIRLALGATIFGLGWGLAGICPGPAIVLLGTGLREGLIFFMAMAAGMLLFALFEQFISAPKQADNDKLLQ